MLGISLMMTGIPVSTLLTNNGGANVGTNIGDATSFGGLAAAYDGSVTFTGGCCGVNSGNAYVGKTFSSAKVITKFIVKSGGTVSLSQNVGGTITGTLYGKNGTPSSATDGTSLWTGTMTNSAGSIDTITSGISSSSYTSLWIYIQPPGGGAMTLGEFELWGY